MDVDPDTMAAVAVEAWVMARAATLLARTPKLAHDAAIEQALVDLRKKYPALGGSLRGMTPKGILG